MLIGNELDEKQKTVERVVRSFSDDYDNRIASLPSSVLRKHNELTFTPEWNAEQTASRYNHSCKDSLAYQSAEYRIFRVSM
ncbi:hypothetical protein KIN20_037264 [Parelaphostrongylus tenuis]|uniref:Uncharacterized protein n=1 Tax=Parelaphostrongylus tenuis TaxID=148309 RepID=A0AAD5WLW3_PARTN|nr:hypothetical protein KIN20_037264 [Parelaphostrongylus tenuis]